MMIGITNSERVKTEKMTGVDTPLEGDKSEPGDPGLATAPSAQKSSAIVRISWSISEGTLR